MNIIPSVGRKVWFYEHKWQVEPIDATIIKVWGDGPQAFVNLDAVDPLTGTHQLKSCDITFTLTAAEVAQGELAPAPAPAKKTAKPKANDATSEFIERNTRPH